jgi:multimeric flavodoxin WrbA
MKVTAIIGSARKKHTYKATLHFLKTLQSLGDVQFETVCLSDYQLSTCQGCKLCLDKGEEHCPLKDDRDMLLEKMHASDGIIMATPNYSFHVSGLMKVFLDRLGFVFHRPQFFGKTFTAIVVEGIYGGKKITKYLNFIGEMMGFNVVKSSCLTTREPISAKQRKKNNGIIEQQAKNYYIQLIKKEYPDPSIIKLMMFRMARTAIKRELDSTYRDYNYFNEKGWFESGYYYPIKLNPFKVMIGRMADRISV